MTSVLKTQKQPGFGNKLISQLLLGLKRLSALDPSRLPGVAVEELQAGKGTLRRSQGFGLARTDSREHRASLLGSGPAAGPGLPAWTSAPNPCLDWDRTARVQPPARRRSREASAQAQRRGAGLPHGLTRPSSCRRPPAPAWARGRPPGRR